MLDTDVGLRAVRRRELRVGAKDRGSDPRCGSDSTTTSGCREHAGRVSIGSNLLEGLHPVFLDRAVEKRQRQAVIEKPKAGAHNPFLRGTPSQADPWTEVILVGTEW